MTICGEPAEIAAEALRCHGAIRDLYKVSLPPADPRWNCVRAMILVVRSWSGTERRI